jgi:predicted AlkP superfamily pyrophosphatase or phosphodiesterase
MMKFASVFAAALALSVAAPQPSAPTRGQNVPNAGNPATRHVVLVTVDGMRGDYLGDADRYGLNIPTLRRLMHEGTFSGRTISVFPTLTGTAHTTLVTGAVAAKHGILGNNRFDPSVWVWAADNPDNYDAQPSYRNHADIKVATLWSAARAKGLKTAAINWPQTAGGPIDYCLDVLMAATGPESHARITRSASPGWLDRIEQKLGPIQAVDLRMVDHFKALVAVETLKQFKPARMAVH